ncbi:MAG: DUF1573 domain-containing protein [bacterium]|nr:DUF1573 domain-containing protein [bacterium]
MRLISCFLKLTLLLAVVAISVQAQPDLKFDERVWEFGHVGIGFKLKHDFIIYNTSSNEYAVDSFAVGCDCSRAKLLDSTLSPGDTARIALEFETNNFYGPTNKSLKVHTSYGGLGQHIFYYQAIVGQWIKGFRPQPESMFFLPGHESKELAFNNSFMDGISLVGIYPYDKSFTVKSVSKRADKGDKIVLEIRPADNLTKGTYESCLTLEFKIDTIEKPFKITIPVKSVRY